MSKVYAIANQKGGVAKTTTTINLATYLAAAGRKVIALDLDPQADMTVGFGENPEKLVKHTYHLLIEDNITVPDVLIYRPNKQVAIIPTNIDLAGAETEIMTDPTLSSSILRSKIEPYREQVDYILIDCPPSLGILTVAALVAADGVIIPCQCQYLSYRGLYKLQNTIKKVKTRLNGSLSITAIIPTMYDSRNKHDREILEELRAHYQGPLIDIPVPRQTVVADSISSFLPINELDANAPAALAYEKIAEIIDGK